MRFESVLACVLLRICVCVVVYLSVNVPIFSTGLNLRYCESNLFSKFPTQNVVPRRQETWFGTNFKQNAHVLALRKLFYCDFCMNLYLLHDSMLIFCHFNEYRPLLRNKVVKISSKYSKIETEMKVRS